MSERYYDWKYKIPKKDKLRGQKREAIKVAVELYYPNIVLEQIILARTELRINNILCNARCSM